MMDEHVLGFNGTDHFPVVDRAVFEPPVSCLHEDLGLEPGAAQDALHAEHFVADRVAVAERGQDLMDARRADSRRAHR